jgi:hypothetical protein
VATPSISFTYSTTTSYTGGDYGFGGQRQSPTTGRGLGLRWNNTLQVKTEKGGKERKTDLADLDLSTGYDFEADARKLSDLTSSLRIKPSRQVNVSVQTGHTFYDRADKLSLRSTRLRSLSINSSLSFSGGKRAGADTRQLSMSDLTADLGEAPGPLGMASLSEFSMPNAERGFDVPVQGWDLRFSYRFSLTKGQSYSRKTQWIQGHTGFSPTRNWRIDYSLNYDLSSDATDRVTSQEFSIYRDLHCWEAKIRWTPSGPRKGYYFLMNIKELPDVKLERRKGRGAQY